MNEKDATGDDNELRDLPGKTTTDSAADDVKGGATPAPSNPIPVPYPNIKPGNARTIQPCI